MVWIGRDNVTLEIISSRLGALSRWDWKRGLGGGVGGLYECWSCAHVNMGTRLWGFV